MSGNIYSSHSHATSVQAWKQRLRAGALVDALDDTGRWGRARVVQLDSDWGKVLVKFEGTGGQQWLALTMGDRLRPPGEMAPAYAGGVQGSRASAASASHAKLATDLRREAILLWVLALLLALLAQWQATASPRFFGLCAAAAAVVCWPWHGALGRTLRSVSENLKSDMSAANGNRPQVHSLGQKLLASVLPKRLGPAFQYWWLRRGRQVDFCNRSGVWIKAEVLKFPFPWWEVELCFAAVSATSTTTSLALVCISAANSPLAHLACLVTMLQGVHNRPTSEWVNVSEQRILPPGQRTGQLTERNTSPGHAGELSGVFNSRLLDSATRCDAPHHSNYIVAFYWTLQ